MKTVDFKGPVVPTSKQENPEKTKTTATTPKNQLQIKIHKIVSEPIGQQQTGKKTKIKGLKPRTGLQNTARASI